MGKLIFFIIAGMHRIYFKQKNIVKVFLISNDLHTEFWEQILQANPKLTISSPFVFGHYNLSAEARCQCPKHEDRIDTYAA